jgi:hypothetical protein
MIAIERVKPEIEALKAIKPNVRHYTAFHDDNHAAIDAQIAVLTEDMDWDTIEGAYGEDEHLYGAASEARTWLDGDDPELDATGLAASWESLT